MRTNNKKQFEHWRAKAGVNNLKVVSVDITLTLLDKEGENYLRLLDAGKTSAYMRQEELIEKHGYIFTKNIKFPSY